MTGWFVGGLCIVLEVLTVILVLALCRAAAPRTPEERAAQDREQLEYLRKERNKHEKRI